MAQRIKETILGSRVKDSVTGFTGIAFARTIYQYGCVQIQILSESLDKDNEEIYRWFDEPRIITIEEEKSDPPYVHGPQKCHPPQRIHND